MRTKVGVGAVLLAFTLAFAAMGSPHSASASGPTISGKLWANVPYAQASEATQANLPATAPDVTFDATSPIQFGYSSYPTTLSDETVGQWLSSGNASNVTDSSAVQNDAMAACSDTTGTMVEFAGVVSVTNGETFDVAHDDGLTLIIGGTPVINAPGPTPPTTTTGTYTGPTGIFAFQLVYGEVRCGPAVLYLTLPLANPTITLNPPSAVNPVGTDHTVTATVDDNNGNPAQDAQVDFSVTSGPNAGTSGTCSINVDCTTDSSGNVSWTYTGGPTAGIDTIQACVHLTQTCTTVIKTWYDPNGGFVTGGGWIGNHDNFGFVAKYHSGATTPTGSVEFQDRDNGVKFHSDNFDANGLVILGDSATLTGTGTLNGVPGVTFTLTATDNSPDTFEIVIGTYDSGLQSLSGGSIQIHS